VRKKKLLHASVYVDASEIVSHLVGLKDLRVLSYARRGPAGELTVEQADPALVCRRCGGRAWVKDRPVVTYVDPFGGVPITLRWKKHRLVEGAKRSRSRGRRWPCVRRNNERGTRCGAPFAVTDAV
jgi:DNA-directed RNA polymerase subunit RPC12/RpoP